MRASVNPRLDLVTSALSVICVVPYCRQPQDGQRMHANAYNTCAWPGARRLRYLITDTMCNNAYKCNNKLRKSEAVRPWYYTYSDYTTYYYIILRLLLLLYCKVWFLRYNSTGDLQPSVLFPFVYLFLVYYKILH